MSAKQENAMRLMKALSGVDETLLERSEAQVGDRERRRQRRKRILKSGRAWAAVVCMAVLGVAAWEGYQRGGEGMESAKNGNCSGAGAVQMSTACGQETAGTTKGEASEEVFVTESVNGGGESNTQDSASNIKEVPKDETTPVRGPDGTMVSGAVSNLAERLTEEEARNREFLGNYIPRSIPEGYCFQEAFWEPESGRLFVSWAHDMDVIVLELWENREGSVNVDVNRPEMYDQRFYEDSYEEVPAGYLEVFSDPVFAWEDFSQSVVESRMVLQREHEKTEDAGNTEGAENTEVPAGNFGILFPEGVLVKFRGAGEPKQVWEMICSMGL